jgi:hypothetical protein
MNGANRQETKKAVPGVCPGRLLLLIAAGSVLDQFLLGAKERLEALRE